jgi:hypothetical protein
MNAPPKHVLEDHAVQAQAEYLGGDQGETATDSCPAEAEAHLEFG